MGYGYVFLVTMPKRRPKLTYKKIRALGTRMTLKAKDLSPDQKMAIESLLGRSISENEEIIIRATTSPSVPECLQASWKMPQDQGLDHLSMTDINSQILSSLKQPRAHPP